MDVGLMVPKRSAFKDQKLTFPSYGDEVGSKFYIIAIGCMNVKIFANLFKKNKIQ